MQKSAMKAFGLAKKSRLLIIALLAAVRNWETKDRVLSTDLVCRGEASHGHCVCFSRRFCDAVCRAMWWPSAVAWRGQFAPQSLPMSIAPYRASVSLRDTAACKLGGLGAAS